MHIQHHLPTRILMEDQAVRKAGEYIAALGTTCLVVCGRHSSRNNGSLHDLEETLRARKVEYRIFDRVLPNPDIAVCRAGALAARECNADFIIAVGGGSAMDAAKAIAALARNDLDDDNLFEGPWKNGALPVVAIPTTAGTGSEVTPFAIITDALHNQKRTIYREESIPVMALLDSWYTAGLSMEGTLHTALDALSHLVEGFLAKKADPFSRSLAREGMRQMGPALKDLATCVRQDTVPEPELRNRLLWASCLGGMVISSSMTTIVHAMGYPLTLDMGLDHGRANGLLLGSYLAWLQKTHPAEVAEVLECLGFSDTGAFASLVDFLLGERDVITMEQMEDFADRSMGTRHGVNTLKVPTREEIRAIFLSSLSVVHEDERRQVS